MKGNSASMVVKRVARMKGGSNLKKEAGEKKFSASLTPPLERSCALNFFRSFFALVTARYIRPLSLSLSLCSLYTFPRRGIKNPRVDLLISLTSTRCSIRLSFVSSGELKDFERALLRAVLNVGS